MSQAPPIPDYDGADSLAPGLRRRAEDIIADGAGLACANGDGMATEPMRKLLHELQVHQIELEMQNDELRKTQAELDAARVRYFDLYDLAPVGYCTINESGLILEANFTAAALLGLTRGDMVKKPMNHFVAKAHQDTYYRCRNALFQLETPQECELEMVSSATAAIWVHIKVSLACDGSGNRQQRMVLSDITERKRIDCVLQAQNKKLEVATGIAERASHAKSDFLSNMSHELRSPLNAILGFAQLMQTNLPAPTIVQAANLDQILRAGWYLLDLVNEVLDLTAIESGKLSLAMGAVSLAGVLQECHEKVAPIARKKNVHVTIAPLAQPLAVHADRDRLAQALANLLTNAIQYNHAGGTVEVTLHVLPQARLRICVQDSGDGLSASKLDALFQPFGRLDSARHDQSGEGVGLALSKRLVELMGGSIGAHSTLGAGSVFWIELKLQGQIE